MTNGMEKIVEDLKNIIPFKDTTDEGDVVLVVANQIFYALVTGIARDETKRDEWWHVTMQALLVPPQKMVWTLRNEQLTGQEIFTMGGEKRFIKAVDFGEPKPPAKKKAAAKKGAGLRLVK